MGRRMFVKSVEFVVVFCHGFHELTLIQFFHSIEDAKNHQKIIFLGVLVAKVGLTMLAKLPQLLLGERVSFQGECLLEGLLRFGAPTQV